MESFSITSKCCFRGLITLPKNISWGNTEMLLCTYCIGQSPKMGNGNGFWHHCRDSGMIIILASFTVGSVSKSFSLFCSSCFCVCVFVCLKDGDWKSQDSCRANASWVSSHLVLSWSLLSCSSVFSCLCACSFLVWFLCQIVWTRVVDIQHGSKLGEQAVTPSLDLRINDLNSCEHVCSVCAFPLLEK